jgi:hypothetical protein
MTETIDQRAKRLGYPAELQTPTMRPRPVGLLSTDRDAEDLLYAVLSDKMRLLMKHYRIEVSDTRCFAQLAFRMAHDWVPGFQIVDKAPRRRGAPRKVTPLDLVQLYIDIYQIHQERPEESLQEACTTYLRRNRNKARSFWGGQTPRSLVNRYREGKRHFEQLANQARRLDTLEDAGARFLLARVNIKKPK